MDDQEYVAALLDILTNPTPTGIDPADPYARADDGIDRSDGFGRDVKVTGAQVVGDPHGDKLEVTFILTPPAGDPDWAGVPEDGAVRVPFDAQWRHLSQFTDPAAYAPVVASRVMWAARDHAVDHQHGGRRAKARAERRTRTRAGLPDRDTQRQLLLDALETEWKVTQVAPDRFELRLRQDPTDNSSDDRAQGSGDELALDAAPEVITFLLSPEEWEEVLVDHHEDVNLYFAETLAAPDPDERFVVFYNGELHCSTRPQLPPVRGRAEERAWARLRENHPLGPDDGWYAFDPPRPGGSRRPAPATTAAVAPRAAFHYAATRVPAHAEMRADLFAVWDRGGVPSVELPNDQGRLDFKFTDDGYSASITCRRPDETIAWQALPPEGDKDAWTDVSVDGTTVAATSWSCWRIRFDVATGQEIERIFTK